MQRFRRFGIVLLALVFAGSVALFFYAKKKSTLKEFSEATIFSKSREQKKLSVSPQLPPAEQFPNPAATDSDDELLELARDAVARSPQQAITWAQSQTAPEMRRRLLFAVAQAWGELDPRSAVDWASQHAGERQFLLEKAFRGALQQPELALELGRKLLTDDPALAPGSGIAFVNALGDAGKFQTAIDFSADAPAELRTNLLSRAFFLWGETKPSDAAKTLDSIQDKFLRKLVFGQMIGGWAGKDTPGLAAYAITLPAGDERNTALHKAFDVWSLQDPAAMGEWLNSVPPSPEFDLAIASMLAKTDSANRSPEVAMSWVESINDPKLRRDSLLVIALQWMQSAPTAAREYVSKVSWLDPSERSEILNSLTESASRDPDE